MARRALVTGWFSFEGMNATAGDVMVRDVVSRWLDEIGQSYDVANAAPYGGGLDWSQVRASDYSDLVFACGPFRYCSPLTELLQRFSHARLIGVDLTILDSPRDAAHPFHILLERDSARMARADASFAWRCRHPPVVGVILVHDQQEYGARAMHKTANSAIKTLLNSRDVAAVAIDTCLERNAGALRTAASVEALIAKMDLVVTTRLHGTVLAIKNGVPPIVVDPIAGGAKVRRHAEAIGWPIVFTADRLVDQELDQAFDHCLTDAARRQVEQCRRRAESQVEDMRLRFCAAFRSDLPPSGGEQQAQKE
jgi:hypothetical protein